ncbi:alcohol dehydrogenase catalytic domain-containing protein [Paenarthrobacter ureafaciens]|uniref:alcohol dehydrogenase catalytic domain-containing protein n=1 Tax=Paenarthrobacter ureafaciens TaxID=37931 RepID=UPI001BB72365|nr:hypothetical protein AYX19_21035 [Paenarthrobacter ureafaciens]
MHGVVVRDGHTELVDDLQVRRPEAGEVTVRVLASGLCRSDLLPIDEPSGAPMVLGHEAAGVIEAVGSAVDGLEIGQMVAVTCPVPCNNCDACSRGLYTACASSFGFGEAPFSRDGLPILALARVSSLAEFITVDQFQVHPVASLSAPAAALVGCAVSTGYGMTRNVVELKTGETIMVFGVGGIGINSIQTARLIGARRIIAVDINEEKEAVARKFGADEFIAIKPGMASESIVAEVRHVAPSKWMPLWTAPARPPFWRLLSCSSRPGDVLASSGYPTRRRHNEARH